MEPTIRRLFSYLKNICVFIFFVTMNQFLFPHNAFAEAESVYLKEIDGKVRIRGLRGGVLFITEDGSDAEPPTLAIRLFNTDAEFWVLAINSSGKAGDSLDLKLINDDDPSETLRIVRLTRYFGATAALVKSSRLNCGKPFANQDSCNFAMLFGTLPIDLVKSPIVFIYNTIEKTFDSKQCLDSFYFLVDREKIGQFKIISEHCYREILSKISIHQ